MTSVVPSVDSTVVPSLEPISAPSLLHSVLPSVVPSADPSGTPSTMPSIIPLNVPSNDPSGDPSSMSSSSPLTRPSSIPYKVPSFEPYLLPSVTPSALPSYVPSAKPSIIPSNIPSSPTEFPSTCADIEIESSNDLCNDPYATGMFSFQLQTAIEKNLLKFIQSETDNTDIGVVWERASLYNFEQGAKCSGSSRRKLNDNGKSKISLSIRGTCDEVCPNKTLPDILNGNDRRLQFGDLQLNTNAIVVRQSR